jgi:hypothetical protein
MGSDSGTARLGPFVSGLGLKGAGVDEADELVDESRSLSWLVVSVGAGEVAGESSASDKRLRVDDECRERIEGSEKLAKVLSMAAAANAKMPPGFCALPLTKDEGGGNWDRRGLWLRLVVDSTEDLDLLAAAALWA